MPSAYSKTVRQMGDAALRLLGDYQGSGKNGRQWTWIEVERALKDTVFALAAATGILKKVQTIQLEENVAVYDLPDDCIRVLRVGIHGLSGRVVLPASMAEYDYQSQDTAATGFPTQFFRDILSPNQIGFYPMPSRAGSSFTRDSAYGLLRRLTDGDGNALPLDANRPLRQIRGVPFRRSGTGYVIRDVISTYGNVQVVYVRAPDFPTNPSETIDSEIPDYVHKDIPYGACLRLMAGSRKGIHRVKMRRFILKWNNALFDLRRRCEHKGPLDAACIPGGVESQVSTELFDYPTE